MTLDDAQCCLDAHVEPCSEAVVVAVLTHEGPPAPWDDGEIELVVTRSRRRASQANWSAADG